jgi:hypothetical protein
VSLTGTYDCAFTEIAKNKNTNKRMEPFGFKNYLFDDGVILLKEQSGKSIVENLPD